MKTNRKVKYSKAYRKAGQKRQELTEKVDAKAREESIIRTRKARRMISIEQYAKDNNITIAQSMIIHM